MTTENAPRPAGTSLWIVAGLAMGPAVALGLAQGLNWETNWIMAFTRNE